MLCRHRRIETRHRASLKTSRSTPSKFRSKAVSKILIDAPRTWCISPNLCHGDALGLKFPEGPSVLYFWPPIQLRLLVADIKCIQLWRTGSSSATGLDKIVAPPTPRFLSLPCLLSGTRENRCNMVDLVVCPTSLWQECSQRLRIDDRAMLARVGYELRANQGNAGAVRSRAWHRPA